jgi:hypothetical protein
MEVSGLCSTMIRAGEATRVSVTMTPGIVTLSNLEVPLTLVEILAPWRAA